MKTARRVHVAWAVLLTAWGAWAGDSIPLTWLPPVVVNDNPGNGGLSTDQYPHVATGGNGLWIIVWESQDTLSSLGDSIGSDRDLFYSRSTDDGVSWSDFAILNGNAATDFEGSPSDNRGYDQGPFLASDGSGGWVCAWATGDSDSDSASDREIYYARSSNSGQTWTLPTRLHGDSAASETNVEVVLDGEGNGVAFWGAVGQGAMLARTTNGGESWIDFEMAGTSGNPPSLFKGLASDGGGNYVAMFPQSPGFPEAAIGAQISSDSGADWTMPQVVIDVSELGDIIWDVETDGDGTWIAFLTLTGDDDRGLYRSVSLDNGMSWSNPAAVAVNADFNDGKAALGNNLDGATDGDGRWVLVWTRLSNVWSSGSTDNGETWTLPQQVNENDLTGKGIFPEPHVAAGANGVFLLTYHDMATAADVGIRDPIRAHRGGFGITVPEDLNGDSTVNAVDVQLVINVVLGVETGVDGDTNNDGTTDATDIQRVINAALGV